jgi:hypothetical protein
MNVLQDFVVGWPYCDNCESHDYYATRRTTIREVLSTGLMCERLSRLSLNGIPI